MLKELLLKLIEFFGAGEFWASISSGMKAEILVSLGLFFANVIVSLIGTVIIGLIGWFIIHRHQNRVMEQEREMNRLNLLDEFEDTINEIYKEKVVQFPQKDDSPEDALYHLGTVFNHEENWKDEFDDPDSIMLDGQRMWKVSEDGTRIASSALQDVILWFRKLNRAYKCDLIDGGDLYILWHHTVPFILDNRYQFFEAFFSHEDIESLRKIMLQTLDYAHREGKTEIFELLSKDDELPYDIDPRFEELADEYFLEEYNKSTEEIISHHLEDVDPVEFAGPPSGNDAITVGSDQPVAASGSEPS